MTLSALAAALLPAAIGLALVAFASSGRGRGADAAALAARAALAAAALSGLLLAGPLQRGGEAIRIPWLAVGRTTRLDWLIELDPLALLVGGVGMAALVAAVLAGLAAGGAAGARPHARAALAAAAALQVGAAGTLWQAALGLALGTMACRTWTPGQDERDMAPWTGVWALGVALTGLGWLAGGGELEFAAIERSALLQGLSDLSRGQVAGVAPATLAAAGVIVAGLGAALAWPRLVARAWPEGAGSRAALVGVAALPLVIPLRGHLALALAPTTTACLAAAAALLAGLAGLRAARGGDLAQVVGACGQAGLAAALAAVALGGYAEALQLGLACALGCGALGVAAASGVRGAARAAAGLAGLGWTAATATALAAIWGGLVAWSPGLNAAAAALVLTAAAGVGAGVWHVLRDMSEAGPEIEAPGLIAGVGVALAAGSAALAAAPLGALLWPGFLTSRTLVGIYAVGPRPEAWPLPWGLALALTAAAVVGGIVAAGRGWRGAALRVRPPRSPVPAGIYALGERLWGGWLARLGDERVAEAARPFDLQRALLAALAGALAIVGTVFCNPDVVVLGPTRVHPVDLGGLDAALVGARGGAAPEEPGRGDRSERPAPPGEEDVRGPGRGDRSERAGQEEDGPGRGDRSERAGQEEDGPGRGDRSERTGKQEDGPGRGDRSERTDGPPREEGAR